MPAMISRRSLMSSLPLGAATGLAACGQFDETKPIAEEAFIYGLPLVMNYAVMNEFFIDTTSGQYKGPFNTVINEANVFTPADTAVVTPNSDTPYSFFCADLRAEPFVFCNPTIERGRYFSLQLVDMYTFNFGYVGTRTTGNGAGCTMIAGPRWNGETPRGVTRVFRCETDFCIGIVRTQLFRAAEIGNVRRIQAQFRGMPLSGFLRRPAPDAAPGIAWPAIDKAKAKSDFFSYLAFILQFCPPIGPAEVEVPLRARFARIGVEAGKAFNLEAMGVEAKLGLLEGAKAGAAQIEARKPLLGTNMNGWTAALDAFGNRARINGDWTRRAAAAELGIYGNDAEEALYPLLMTDSKGNKPDCTSTRYTLTFPQGQLPPVNAFWSVTMYVGKTQLLVANPLNRYLINSPMLPGLKRDADGSLTLFIQSDDPGPARRANWLPAPKGPIYVVMRLYYPKESALQGQWKPPALVPVS
jgi:hypothetical protein